MKKFLTMFLFAAAVAGAFSFVLAEEESTGEKKFVLHGEIRQRFDFNDNLSDFTGDSDDSFAFFPYRARIGAEGHFGNDVVGYVEFQSIGYWGDIPPIKGFQFGPVFGDNVSGPSNPPFGGNTNIVQNVNSGQFFSNDVELYQGYLALQDIGDSRFSLMLGRQEIVKGSEMLLGDNDFYSGISHDGAMGCWKWDHFDLDLWWTRPLQSGGFFSDPDHQSINFYGAWLDWARYKNGVSWSAYILDYEDGTTSTLNPTRRQFWTVGGRSDREVIGKNGFYWNAELAYQTGEYNNGPGLGDTADIEAMAWEGTIGYNFDGDRDQKVHVTYDMASGDDDATDDDAEFFDPLFQDSHNRYGFTDLFTFSNLTVWGAGYSMNMNEKHSWGVDFWNQELTEEIVGGPADGHDALGQELDAWWKLQYSPNTQILVGAAWFDPGDAISEVVEFFGESPDSGIRGLAQVRLRW